MSQIPPRRRADALALALAILTGAACSDAPEPPTGQPRGARSQRPNLLFVYSDQHRGDVAGFAGDEFVRTPNLDRLAAGGVALTHTMVAAPVCVPSRACLMTSQPVDLHRVRNNHASLPEDALTWPMSLTAEGYRAIAVGRVHGICAGFEHRRVAAGRDSIQRAQAEVRAGGAPISGLLDEGEHWDAHITSEARATLRELSAQEQPFALYVGYLSPHTPHIPPRGFAGRHDQALLPMPIPAAGAEEERPPWLSLESASIEPTPVLRPSRARYWEMVEYFDHELGLLLGELDALGLSEDTLVVYTSDHGAPLRDHGLHQKYVSFYESIMRVPTLLRMPGRLPPGRVDSTPISSIDLAPTILALMGVDSPPEFYGVDRSALALGLDVPPPTPVFASLDLTHIGRRGERGYMVRWPGSKYCWYQGGHQELYDLEQDPEERHSLHAQPSHAPLLRQMRADLVSHMARMRLAAPERELAATQFEGQRVESRVLARINALHLKRGDSALRVRPFELAEWRDASGEWTNVEQLGEARLPELFALQEALILHVAANLGPAQAKTRTDVCLD